MLTILEAAQDVDKAQAAFADSIRALSTETIPVTIGYQGGSHVAKVMLLPSVDIWAYLGYPPDEKSLGERYWNVFGVEMPAGLVPIVCEINPPFQGINRKAAGAFAKRSDERVSIIHRGRLNGMSKRYFREHYRGTWVDALDGNAQAKVVLVATIGEPEFGAQLKHFVFEVQRIKHLARGKTR